MDAPRFDALARSLVEIRTRRGALRGLLLGAGGLVGLAAAQDAAAKNCRKIKNKKRRKKCLANQKPPTCAATSRCGDGCCSADSCFASAVADEVVLGYGCCSAEKLCRSTKPNFQDQCCYPDETCQPSLTDDINAETICCRPCGTGCCLRQNEECIEGACQQINTARLPRYRRPG